MKFLDLFSGIGGFRLGLEMAGHEGVGHVEWDKFAQASYMAMHNVKESEFIGWDIKKIRADELPSTDIWTFGFPCQDISVAGKQTGFRGHRSSLFFAVTGLIRDLKEEDRPSILFIENVKNLFSVNGGFDFAKLLIELDEIGYNAEWQVLNSKHFGVPQNRERVFIIGHLRGRGGRKVFPITGQSGQTVKQVGNIVNTGNWDNPQRGRIYSAEGISPSLNCCGGGGLEPKIAIPVLTPDRLEKRQNGRRFKTDGEPMFTLTGQDRHGVAINIKGTDGISNTVRASGRGSLTQKHNWDTIYDGLIIRKLTPRECFRLQGFPDEYFDRAAEVNSDSQLYKQAGNSVTVNVIYEIAKRLGAD